MSLDWKEEQTDCLLDVEVEERRRMTVTGCLLTRSGGVGSTLPDKIDARITIFDCCRLASSVGVE